MRPKQHTWTLCAVAFEAASRKMFGDLIGRLPEYLSEAYCVSSVKNVWQKTSMYPNSPLQMLT